MDNAVGSSTSVTNNSTTQVRKLNPEQVIEKLENDYKFKLSAGTKDVIRSKPDANWDKMFSSNNVTPTTLSTLGLGLHVYSIKSDPSNQFNPSQLFILSNREVVTDSKIAKNAEIGNLVLEYESPEVKTSKAEQVISEYQKKYGGISKGVRAYIAEHIDDFNWVGVLRPGGMPTAEFWAKHNVYVYKGLAGQNGKEPQYLLMQSDAFKNGKLVTSFNISSDPAKEEIIRYVDPKTNEIAGNVDSNPSEIVSENRASLVPKEDLSRPINYFVNVSGGGRFDEVTTVANRIRDVLIASYPEISSDNLTTEEIIKTLNKTVIDANANNHNGIVADYAHICRIVQEKGVNDISTEKLRHLFEKSNQFTSNIQIKNTSELKVAQAVGSVVNGVLKGIDPTMGAKGRLSEVLMNYIDDLQNGKMQVLFLNGNIYFVGDNGQPLADRSDAKYKEGDYLLLTLAKLLKVQIPNSPSATNADTKSRIINDIKAKGLFSSIMAGTNEISYLKPATIKRAIANYRLSSNDNFSNFATVDDSERKFNWSVSKQNIYRILDDGSRDEKQIEHIYTRFQDYLDGKYQLKLQGGRLRRIKQTDLFLNGRSFLHNANDASGPDSIDRDVVKLLSKLLKETGDPFFAGKSSVNQSLVFQRLANSSNVIDHNSIDALMAGYSDYVVDFNEEQSKFEVNFNDNIDYVFSDKFLNEIGVKDTTALKGRLQDLRQGKVVYTWTDNGLEKQMKVNGTLVSKPMDETDNDLVQKLMKTMYAELGVLEGEDSDVAVGYSMVGGDRVLNFKDFTVLANTFANVVVNKEGETYTRSTQNIWSILEDATGFSSVEMKDNFKALVETTEIWDGDKARPLNEQEKRLAEIGFNKVSLGLLSIDEKRNMGESTDPTLALFYRILRLQKFDLVQGNTQSTIIDCVGENGETKTIDQLKTDVESVISGLFDTLGDWNVTALPELKIALDNSEYKLDEAQIKEIISQVVKEKNLSIDVEKIVILDEKERKDKVALMYNFNIKPGLYCPALKSINADRLIKGTDGDASIIGDVIISDGIASGLRSVTFGELYCLWTKEGVDNTDNQYAGLMNQFLEQVSDQVDFQLTLGNLKELPKEKLGELLSLMDLRVKVVRKGNNDNVYSLVLLNEGSIPRNPVLEAIEKGTVSYDSASGEFVTNEKFDSNELEAAKAKLKIWERYAAPVGEQAEIKLNPSGGLVDKMAGAQILRFTLASIKSTLYDDSNLNAGREAVDRIYQDLTSDIIDKDFIGKFIKKYEGVLPGSEMEVLKDLQRMNNLSWRGGKGLVDMIESSSTSPELREKLVTFLKTLHKVHYQILLESKMYENEGEYAANVINDLLKEKANTNKDIIGVDQLDALVNDKNLAETFQKKFEELLKTDPLLKSYLNIDTEDEQAWSKVMNKALELIKKKDESIDDYSKKWNALNVEIGESIEETVAKVILRSIAGEKLNDLVSSSDSELNVLFNMWLSDSPVGSFDKTSMDKLIQLIDTDLDPANKNSQLRQLGSTPLEREEITREINALRELVNDGIMVETLEVGFKHQKNDGLDTKRDKMASLIRGLMLMLKADEGKTKIGEASPQSLLYFAAKKKEEYSLIDQYNEEHPGADIDDMDELKSKGEAWYEDHKQELETVSIKFGGASIEGNVGADDFAKYLKDPQPIEESGNGSLASFFKLDSDESRTFLTEDEEHGWGYGVLTGLSEYAGMITELPQALAMVGSGVGSLVSGAYHVSAGDYQTRTERMAMVFKTEEQIKNMGAVASEFYDIFTAEAREKFLKGKTEEAWGQFVVQTYFTLMLIGLVSSAGLRAGYKIARSGYEYSFDGYRWVKGKQITDADITAKGAKYIVMPDGEVLKSSPRAFKSMMEQKVNEMRIAIGRQRLIDAYGFEYLRNMDPQKLEKECLRHGMDAVSQTRGIYKHDVGFTFRGFGTAYSSIKEGGIGALTNADTYKGFGGAGIRPSETALIDIFSNELASKGTEVGLRRKAAGWMSRNIPILNLALRNSDTANGRIRRVKYDQRDPYRNMVMGQDNKSKLRHGAGMTGRFAFDFIARPILDMFVARPGVNEVTFINVQQNTRTPEYKADQERNVTVVIRDGETVTTGKTVYEDPKTGSRYRQYTDLSGRKVYCDLETGAIHSGQGLKESTIDADLGQKVLGVLPDLVSTKVGDATKNPVVEMTFKINQDETTVRDVSVQRMVFTSGDKIEWFLYTPEQGRSLQPVIELRIPRGMVADETALKVALAEAFDTIRDARPKAPEYKDATRTLSADDMRAQLNKGIHGETLSKLDSDKPLSSSDVKAEIKAEGSPIKEAYDNVSSNKVRRGFDNVLSKFGANLTEKDIVVLLNRLQDMDVERGVRSKELQERITNELVMAKFESMLDNIDKALTQTEFDSILKRVQGLNVDEILSSKPSEMSLDDAIKDRLLAEIITVKHEALGDKAKTQDVQYVDAIKKVAGDGGTIRIERVDSGNGQKNAIVIVAGENTRAYGTEIPEGTRIVITVDKNQAGRSQVKYDFQGADVNSLNMERSLNDLFGKTSLTKILDNLPEKQVGSGIALNLNDSSKLSSQMKNLFEASLASEVDALRIDAEANIHANELKYVGYDNEKLQERHSTISEALEARFEMILSGKIPYNDPEYVALQKEGLVVFREGLRRSDLGDLGIKGGGSGVDGFFKDGFLTADGGKVRTYLQDKGYLDATGTKFTDGANLQKMINDIQRAYDINFKDVVKGFRLNDMQVMGALAMTRGRGNIINQLCGEGKTAVVAAAGYVLSLNGEGVHISSANTDLAGKDLGAMGPAFKFLSKSNDYAAFLSPDLTPTQKRDALRAAITYSDMNTYMYTYETDAAAENDNQKILPRPYRIGIGDEIDQTAMIEDAVERIISGSRTEDGPTAQKNFFLGVDVIAQKMMMDANGNGKSDFFTTDKDGRFVTLTQSNHKTIDEMLRICDQLNTKESKAIKKIITNAHNSKDQATLDIVATQLTKAINVRTFYTLDVDFQIGQDDNAGKIGLISGHSNQVDWGRKLQKGMHQAIEAMVINGRGENELGVGRGEGIDAQKVDVSAVTKTDMYIGIRDFLKIYSVFSGSSGTASQFAAEFASRLGMDVTAIARANRDRLDTDAVTKPGVYTTDAAKNKGFNDAFIKDRSGRLNELALVQAGDIPHAHKLAMHCWLNEVVRDAGEKGIVLDDAAINALRDIANSKLHEGKDISFKDFAVVAKNRLGRIGIDLDNITNRIDLYTGEIQDEDMAARIVKDSGVTDKIVIMTSRGGRGTDWPTTYHSVHTKIRDALSAKGELSYSALIEVLDSVKTKNTQEELILKGFISQFQNNKTLYETDVNALRAFLRTNLIVEDPSRNYTYAREAILCSIKGASYEDAWIKAAVTVMNERGLVPDADGYIKDVGLRVVRDKYTIIMEGDEKAAIDNKEIVSRIQLLAEKELAITDADRSKLDSRVNTKKAIEYLEARARMEGIPQTEIDDMKNILSEINKELDANRAYAKENDLDASKLNRNVLEVTMRGSMLYIMDFSKEGRAVIEQLKNRVGRNGAKGFVQAFISLEDDVFKAHTESVGGQPSLKVLLSEMNFEGGEIKQGTAAYNRVREYVEGVLNVADNKGIDARSGDPVGKSFTSVAWSMVNWQSELRSCNTAAEVESKLEQLRGITIRNVIEGSMLMDSSGHIDDASKGILIEVLSKNLGVSVDTVERILGSGSDRETKIQSLIVEANRSYTLSNKPIEDVKLDANEITKAIKYDGEKATALLDVLRSGLESKVAEDGSMIRAEIKPFIDADGNILRMPQESELKAIFESIGEKIGVDETKFLGEMKVLFDHMSTAETRQVRNFIDLITKENIPTKFLLGIKDIMDEAGRYTDGTDENRAGSDMKFRMLAESFLGMMNRYGGTINEARSNIYGRGINSNAIAVEGNQVVINVRGINDPSEIKALEQRISELTPEEKVSMGFDEKADIAVKQSYDWKVDLNIFKEAADAVKDSPQIKTLLGTANEKHVNVVELSKGIQAVLAGSPQRLSIGDMKISVNADGNIQVVAKGSNTPVILDADTVEKLAGFTETMENFRANNNYDKLTANSRGIIDIAISERLLAPVIDGKEVPGEKIDLNAAYGMREIKVTTDGGDVTVKVPQLLLERIDSEAGARVLVEGGDVKAYLDDPKYQDMIKPFLGDVEYDQVKDGIRQHISENSVKAQAFSQVRSILSDVPDLGNMDENVKNTVLAKLTDFVDTHSGNEKLMNVDGTLTPRGQKYVDDMIYHPEAFGTSIKSDVKENMFQMLAVIGALVVIRAINGDEMGWENIAYHALQEISATSSFLKITWARRLLRTPQAAGVPMAIAFGHTLVKGVNKAEGLALMQTATSMMMSEAKVKQRTAYTNFVAQQASKEVTITTSGAFTYTSMTEDGSAVTAKCEPSEVNKLIDQYIAQNKAQYDSAFRTMLGQEITTLGIDRSDSEAINDARVSVRATLRDQIREDVKVQWYLEKTIYTRFTVTDFNKIEAVSENMNMILAGVVQKEASSFTLAGKPVTDVIDNNTFMNLCFANGDALESMMTKLQASGLTAAQAKDLKSAISMVKGRVQHVQSEISEILKQAHLRKFGSTTLMKKINDVVGFELLNDADVTRMATEHISIQRTCPITVVDDYTPPGKAEILTFMDEKISMLEDMVEQSAIPTESNNIELTLLITAHSDLLVEYEVDGRMYVRFKPDVTPKMISDRNDQALGQLYNRLIMSTQAEKKIEDMKAFRAEVAGKNDTQALEILDRSRTKIFGSNAPTLDQLCFEISRQTMTEEIKSESLYPVNPIIIFKDEVEAYVEGNRAEVEAKAKETMGDDYGRGRQVLQSGAGLGSFMLVNNLLKGKAPGKVRIMASMCIATLGALGVDQLIESHYNSDTTLGEGMRWTSENILGPMAEELGVLAYMLPSYYVEDWVKNNAANLVNGIGKNISSDPNFDVNKNPTGQLVLGVGTDVGLAVGDYYLLRALTSKNVMGGVQKVTSGIFNSKAMAPMTNATRQVNQMMAKAGNGMFTNIRHVTNSSGKRVLEVFMTSKGKNELAKLGIKLQGNKWLAGETGDVAKMFKSKQGAIIGAAILSMLALKAAIERDGSESVVSAMAKGVAKGGGELLAWAVVEQAVTKLGVKGGVSVGSNLIKVPKATIYAAMLIALAKSLAENLPTMMDEGEDSYSKWRAGGDVAKDVITAGVSAYAMVGGLKIMYAGGMMCASGVGVIPGAITVVVGGVVFVVGIFADSIIEWGGEVTGIRENMDEGNLESVFSNQGIRLNIAERDRDDAADSIIENEYQGFKTVKQWLTKETLSGGKTPLQTLKDLGVRYLDVDTMYDVNPAMVFSLINQVKEMKRLGQDVSSISIKYEQMFSGLGYKSVIYDMQAGRSNKPMKLTVNMGYRRSHDSRRSLVRDIVADGAIVVDGTKYIDVKMGSNAWNKLIFNIDGGMWTNYALSSTGFELFSMFYENGILDKHFITSNTSLNGAKADKMLAALKNGSRSAFNELVAERGDDTSRANIINNLLQECFKEFNENRGHNSIYEPEEYKWADMNKRYTEWQIENRTGSRNITGYNSLNSTEKRKFMEYLYQKALLGEEKYNSDINDANEVFEQLGFDRRVGIRLSGNVPRFISASEQKKFDDGFRKTDLYKLLVQNPDFVKAEQEHGLQKALEMYPPLNISGNNSGYMGQAYNNMFPNLKPASEKSSYLMSGHFKNLVSYYLTGDDFKELYLEMMINPVDPNRYEQKVYDGPVYEAVGAHNAPSWSVIDQFRETFITSGVYKTVEGLKRGNYGVDITDQEMAKLDMANDGDYATALRMCFDPALELSPKIYTDYMSAQERHEFDDFLKEYGIEREDDNEFDVPKVTQKRSGWDGKLYYDKSTEEYNFEDVYSMYLTYKFVKAKEESLFVKPKIQEAPDAERKAFMQYYVNNYILNTAKYSTLSSDYADWAAKRGNVTTEVRDNVTIEHRNVTSITCVADIKDAQERMEFVEHFVEKHNISTSDYVGPDRIKALQQSVRLNQAYEGIERNVDYYGLEEADITLDIARQDVGSDVSSGEIDAHLMGLLGRINDKGLNPVYKDFGIAELEKEIAEMRAKLDDPGLSIGQRRQLIINLREKRTTLNSRKEQKAQMLPALERLLTYTKNLKSSVLSFDLNAIKGYMKNEKYDGFEADWALFKQLVNSIGQQQIQQINSPSNNHAAKIKALKDISLVNEEVEHASQSVSSQAAKYIEDENGPLYESAIFFMDNLIEMKAKYGNQDPANQKTWWTKLLAVDIGQNGINVELLNDTDKFSDRELLALASMRYKIKSSNPNEAYSSLSKDDLVLLDKALKVIGEMQVGLVEGTQALSFTERIEIASNYKLCLSREQSGRRSVFMSALYDKAFPRTYNQETRKMEFTYNKQYVNARFYKLFNPTGYMRENGQRVRILIDYSGNASHVDQILGRRTVQVMNQNGEWENEPGYKLDDIFTEIKLGENKGEYQNYAKALPESIREDFLNKMNALHQVGSCSLSYLKIPAGSTGVETDSFNIQMSVHSQISYSGNGYVFVSDGNNFVVENSYDSVIETDNTYKSITITLLQQELMQETRNQMNIFYFTSTGLNTTDADGKECTVTYDVSSNGELQVKSWNEDGTLISTDNASYDEIVGFLKRAK